MENSEKQNRRENGKVYRNRVNSVQLNSKFQTPNSNLGITLIALVVTIVILLILAGITINLVLADGGIFGKAEQSVEEHEKGAAKEKLELKLADLHIDKLSNNKYSNQEEFNSYLKEELTEQEFVLIADDIVDVDGWKFQIDRSVPKIIGDLGKGNRNEGIELEITQPNEATDFVKAIISIKITTSEEIESVTINGEQIEVTESTEETVEGSIVYTGTKEIENNGTYSVIAKNTKEEYNNGTIKISSITEDMEIWTKADLVLFSNKVNEGRTFEGKTVKVMANIDFAGSEEEQYVVAGSDTKPFKGTFEGNNKTISNLYINNTSNYQGLIGYSSGGNISNVILKDANITGNNYVGAIVGYFANGEITNCITIGKVYGTNDIGGIAGRIENSKVNKCGNNAEITGYCNVAGIVGQVLNINSEITEVYNKGDISTTGTGVGGIVGRMHYETDNGNKVKYVYNTGNIVANAHFGGIVGYGGRKSEISNSYNSGNIKTTGNSTYTWIGGIVGYYYTSGKISYCYNVGFILNTGNGDSSGGIIGGADQYTSVQYCYNDCYNEDKISVQSNHDQVGGIAGWTGNYSNITNCYISSLIKINRGTTSATANIGGSSKYLGKFIGYKNGSASENYILDNMPTVYNVVNGLSDGDSQYWSKDGDLNAPKLLWEEK